MHYETDKNNHGLPFNPFKSCVVPRPIAWISTLGRHGTANLAPFSQFNIVGWDPPYIMFAADQGRKDPRHCGQYDQTQRPAAGGADVRRDVLARRRSDRLGRGVFGPAGLPPDVVATLGAALQKFATDPEMNRQLNAGGTQPAWVGPSDMPAHLAADILRWTKLAKDAGIQPE